jgi:hypothetical protein
MTQEEKNIKLAELEGWKKGEANVNPDHSKAQGFWRNGYFYIGDEKLPNYFEDLNAVHLLEKMLTPNQQLEYASNLNNSSFPIYEMSSFRLVNSPAAEKCEALGKTLNLW